MAEVGWTLLFVVALAAALAVYWMLLRVARWLVLRPNAPVVDMNRRRRLANDALFLLGWAATFVFVPAVGVFLAVAAALAVPEWMDEVVSWVVAVPFAVLSIFHLIRTARSLRESAW